MIRKRGILRIVYFLLLAEILLAASDCPAENINNTEVVNLLKTREAELNSAHIKISSFVLTQNATINDPSQGLVFQTCSATWNKDSIAMKVIYFYEKEPIYVAPEEKIYKPYEYDENNRLIVWRFLESYIIATPTKNEMVDKLQVFFVDPNNKVEAGDGSTVSKNIFTSNSRDSVYKFNQFFWTSGIGVLENMDLNNIDSIKAQPVGLLEISSTGNYGKHLRGTWKITIDPNSDYAIKRADLIIPSKIEPLVSITMSETVKKDNIVFAKSGNISFPGILSIDVSTNDISTTDTNLLYNEVLEYLDKPLPVGSSINDFTGEKPIRRTVEK